MLSGGFNLGRGSRAAECAMRREWIQKVFVLIMQHNQILAFKLPLVSSSSALRIDVLSDYILN